MDTSKLFSKVIDAQEKHNMFLDATQKNLSYFLFGKNIGLVKKTTQTTIPMVDILNVINNFNPSPDNPLQNVVSAFTDEISVSDFRTSVKPYPVEGKDPYDAYADMLESYLTKVHRDSKRRSYMKAISFELLYHGYFGIYFDGTKYYFLTAYDLIPGDKSIFDYKRQPFWIRRTQTNKSTLRRAGIDPATEATIFPTLDELEMFLIYDVYVESQDLNIGYTSSGKVVYRQKLRYPKEYPLFVANTSEIINCFYPVPVMSGLVQKLKDFQDARTSIKESASSIAKPILVYDDDSGIDVNKLLAALKQGYKHIIVGKNREGDIGFKAPGQLPAYAQLLPEQIEEDIMKALGLNKAFMGFASQGARERGALARLIKTSFRRLASLSGIIEDVFTDLDKYILEYIQNHSLSLRDYAGINIEEIFNGKISYEPTERFTAYSTEDSYENRMFTLNQWKNKLLPSADALEQLGDSQPRRTLSRLRQEAIDQQTFNIDMQKKIGVKANLSLMDQVAAKLNGQLRFRYFMSPLVDGKLLVKANLSDMKLAAFLLSSLTVDVLLEPEIVSEPVPPEQTSSQKPSIVPSTVPIGGSIIEPAVQSAVQPEETRGRPANPALGIKKPNVSQEIKENLVQSPNSIVPATVNSFDPNEINQYVSKSKVIYDVEKFKDLPGMYIVEPHAKWLFLGRKTALVMASNEPQAINKPMLFCGKKVYGIIVLRKIVSDFDFKATQKYHMVNERERMRWWGNKPLYLYLFEFYPFKYPVDYVKIPGIQTFVPHIEIISDSEIPVK